MAFYTKFLNFSFVIHIILLPFSKFSFSCLKIKNQKKNYLKPLVIHSFILYDPIAKLLCILHQFHIFVQNNFCLITVSKTFEKCMYASHFIQITPPYVQVFMEKSLQTCTYKPLLTVWWCFERKLHVIENEMGS